jgi:DNA-binding HxlR family transcriptional regulator
MSRRSYDQYCPVAQALDQLGERWTLLVVRELIAGPKRYTDLRRGLPGIATDLLTTRLRDLESWDIARRRRLPPPAASMVYELTERGRELEPVIHHLGRFGLSLLPDKPPDDEAIPPDRVGIALGVLLDREAMRGKRERFRLELDSGTIAVAIDDGELELDSGPTAAEVEADVTVEASISILWQVAVGSLDPAEAVARGGVRIHGEDGAQRFLVAFPPFAGRSS